MDTRRTNVTVHVVPIDISEDRQGAFFAQYGKVERVGGVISKAGISTGDALIEITLTRKNFNDIPNVIMCRDRRILVVVEGYKPYCWACGISGHMAKACPGKKTAPQLTAAPVTTTSAATEAEPSKTPGEGWKEVVAKGFKQKASPSSTQKEVTPKLKHPPKVKPV